MGSTKERSGVIDIARGIAIFLVVFAHTMFTGRPDDRLQRLIYQFHMPLFFFISGMVLRSPAPHDPRTAAAEFRTFLRKRARAYLLPYFLWGVVFMQVSPAGLVKLAYGSGQALESAQTGGTLWFLPVQFLACAWCGALLLAVRDRPRPRLLLLGAAVLLFAAGFALPHPLHFGYPFGFDVSLVAAGFMLLGYTALPLLRRLQTTVLAAGGVLPVCLGSLLSTAARTTRYIWLLKNMAI